MDSVTAGVLGSKTEHAATFDTAMGQRAITPMGHVRMTAAVQSILSGPIYPMVMVFEVASPAEK